MGRVYIRMFQRNSIIRILRIETIGKAHKESILIIKIETAACSWFGFICGYWSAFINSEIRVNDIPENNCYRQSNDGGIMYSGYW